LLSLQHRAIALLLHQFLEAHGQAERSEATGGDNDQRKML